MPPLTSIETDFPIIDANFRSFCASHGILTVEDFISHDIHSLAAYAQQQPSPHNLKQGIDQVLAIIDAMHPPWVNATHLLEHARFNKHLLSTGSQSLDLLLNGGLQEGHLTEVAGPSSSGKTQLCLLSAATVAFRHTGCVTYVDTGNSFSPRRVAHFIGPVDHKALQKFMNNIICHSLYDIFSLLDVLHELDLRLKSQICDGDGRVRLLIVDSISSLIAPILGGNGPQGHALMISTGSLLKKLAHEYNIAVLITNHTVGGNQGSTKPALGDSWKSIPHARLLLSRVCGSSTCNVSVLKHPSVASTKAAEFTLYD